MEIIENLFETNFKEESKKTQIVLTHTSRTLFDYMVSLKFRFGGKPIKLPHYVIGRDGKVIHLLEDTSNGNFTNNDKINSKGIIISLENLGWLEKEPLKNRYINWIGNIYNGKAFERKWRDYFLWQPYTEVQIDSTILICKKLMEDFNISKKCVGHNTKVNGVNKFEGIVTRSNYTTDVTDLSPAFDFDYFKKSIEDE
jgi:N-acetyl-anhydromuramyl-L-alanine amidase AmpD